MENINELYFQYETEIKKIGSLSTNLRFALEELRDSVHSEWECLPFFYNDDVDNSLEEDVSSFEQELEDFAHNVLELELKFDELKEIIENE